MGKRFFLINDEEVAQIVEDATEKNDLDESNTIGELLAALRGQEEE